MKYIGIGIKRKSEAEKERRKAINRGFKGVKIVPFTPYRAKKPYHYDITYESTNPLIKRIVKDNKNIKIINYTRKTPKGIIRVGTDIIRKK